MRYFILILIIASFVATGAPPDHAKGKKKDRPAKEKPSKPSKPKKPGNSPYTDDGGFTWISTGDISGSLFNCGNEPCAYTPIEKHGWNTRVFRGAGDDYDTFTTGLISSDWSRVTGESVALNCGDIFPPYDINPISGEPYGYIDSCARTVGVVAHQDGSCVAMLNPQNYYDLSGYPIGYAWATSPNCVNWNYHGFITIEGTISPRYRGSSNALVYRDGVYYYITDSSPNQGLGVLYGNHTTGWQWLRDDTGTAITVAGDARVFPTAALAPNGVIHIMASVPVVGGWVADTVQHWALTISDTGVNSCLLANQTGAWNGGAKSPNIMFNGNRLHAVIYGEHRYTDISEPITCP